MTASILINFTILLRRRIIFIHLFTHKNKNKPIEIDYNNISQTRNNLATNISHFNTKKIFLQLFKLNIINCVPLQYKSLSFLCEERRRRPVKQTFRVYITCISNANLIKHLPNT